MSNQYYTVYVDVLFITNFIINYFLLITTAAFLKLDKKESRLIMSSMLGAIYAVCMFYPYFSVFYSFAFKLLFSISMLCLAFGFKTIKRFLRILAAFYIICFVFGGGAFALYYFTDIGSRLNIVLNNGIFYINLSLPMLLLFIAVSYILVNYAFSIFKDKAKSDYVDIDIYLNDKKCTIKAFLDTGNMLKNPLTSKGVIVCQLDSVLDLIPGAYVDFFLNYDLKTPPADQSFKIFLLPYCSLGKSDGVIPSFKSDKIKYTFNNQEHEIKNVSIAVSKNKLSSDDSYFALMNPAMI